jgi:hypothetical protein
MFCAAAACGVAAATRRDSDRPRRGRRCWHSFFIPASVFFLDGPGGVRVARRLGVAGEVAPCGPGPSPSGRVHVSRGRATNKPLLRRGVVWCVACFSWEN